jgi:predicted phage terminase large subunit-like protein
VGENRWIKHTPTPKQSEFLLLADASEILFGGAAGGGKSDALLMAALQFADVRGYSALLLRRTYTDLSMPGGLMSRACEWLAGTAARWSDVTKTWSFPSGATLSFGYLDSANDRYRYQSSEFQFVAFDELTQFAEADYLYLFSRLRRLKDSQVPLRMRAASNPGGVGHAWVKRRFLTPDAVAAGRSFVPARLTDNPNLDQDEYTRALMNLDPFTRNQLLKGDWSEFEGNHFHPDEWPRYRWTGDAYWLMPHRVVLARDVWTFVVVDPATESKKTADYTAMIVVGVVPGGDLLVLDVLRQRLDVGDIVPSLAGLCRCWGPSFVGMESVAFQRLLVLEAAKHPDIAPVRELKPAGKGKLARAVAAIVKAERREIHLPPDAEWLGDFVTEVAGFTGAGDAHDDQVDCLAYAVTAAGTFTEPDDSYDPLVAIGGFGFAGGLCGEGTVGDEDRAGPSGYDGGSLYGR